MGRRRELGCEKKARINGVKNSDGVSKLREITYIRKLCGRVGRNRGQGLGWKGWCRRKKNVPDERQKVFCRRVKNGAGVKDKAQTNRKKNVGEKSERQKITQRLIRGGETTHPPEGGKGGN